MCGVYAELGAKGEDIAAAVEMMKHRGTREPRIAQTRTGAIGHVRLPIVGLGPENDQPMHRKGWSVGFVGEILDFRERFPGADCDSTIAMDTWIDQGPMGFTEYDGFWSIVALNSNEESLHCLVDYLAQKPLYYRADKIVAACSELDPLKSRGPVTFDKVYMSACIKWGYCPDQRRTPYNEIKKVLPGEYVRLFPSGRVIAQVVDKLEPQWHSNYDDLREEIVKATKRRVLSADVPVACLVSGGLDSSIVYTLARRFSDQVVPYYAQPVEHPTDLTNAQELARVQLLMNENDAEAKVISWEAGTLEEGLHYMQEPVDLGSLIPQIALANAISEPVVLTGDGADECFGGYGRAMRYDSQYSDIFQEMVMWHLPRLDRVMMRHAIELRSPFLARSVVEGAMGVPWIDRRDKGLLRAMFSEDLPRGLAEAPKIPLRTKEVDRSPEDYRKLLVMIFTGEQY
ncbi:MAG: hypothetical protein EHM78_02020 [Myxococcaceae bacterium]|nr:MAG: hypothetical protein EHM78_02020 [Myxococcaceae bacterium]